MGFSTNRSDINRKAFIYRRIIFIFYGEPFKSIHGKLMLCLSLFTLSKFKKKTTASTFNVYVITFFGIIENNLMLRNNSLFSVDKILIFFSFQKSVAEELTFAHLVLEEGING